MYESDLIAEQDALRTKRAFISFLSTAFGVDQSMPGQDGYAANYPRQYQVVGQNGAVGVEGAPISNLQVGTLLRSPVVLLLGGAFVAYLVLKG